MEESDEEKSYYIGNALPKDFTDKTPEFVTLPDTSSTATDSALIPATGSALKVGDYVLVVTDPSGKVFPAYGQGGNGKADRGGYSV